MTAPWQSPDLDEIRPDRFVINNAKVRPILKGEGVVVGKFFELVTWRRDGLIARIRERGFNVRTIRDRIAALPVIEQVRPPGEAGIRLLTNAKERIAVFDRAELRWRDVPPFEQGGKLAVQLRDGVALRRRKSRGHADYYITIQVVNDQINLLPASETTALLHAYGQIASLGPPARVRFYERGDVYIVPERQAILPPAHHEVLNLLTREKAERWTFPKAIAELVEDVFATLQIHLEPESLSGS